MQVRGVHQQNVRHLATGKRAVTTFECGLAVCVIISPVHEPHEAVPLELTAHVELGLNNLWLSVHELSLDISCGQGALHSGQRASRKHGQLTNYAANDLHTKAPMEYDKPPNSTDFNMQDRMCSHMDDAIQILPPGTAYSLAQRFRKRAAKVHISPKTTTKSESTCSDHLVMSNVTTGSHVHDTSKRRFYAV